MPVATLGDVRLFYDLHGPETAPPLVLIAGRSSDHSAWLPQLPALSQHYRVLVFDHRGVGQSDVPEHGYTIQQLADDTLRLMDHVGFDRAHIIGASMGGYIAQELAITARERIAALILAVTQTHSDGWLHNIWAITRAMADQNVDREIRARIGLLTGFSPSFLADPTAVEQMLQLSLSMPQQPLAGLHGHIAACRSHDTRGRVESIDRPTLVVAGQHDLLMPLPRVQALAAVIVGARFVVLPGGHGLTAECARQFNALALAFLSEHDRLLERAYV